MDKQKREKKPRLIESIIGSVKGEAARRKAERGAVLVDIALFLCAFVLARRHIAFGTYPLGAALVAVLPRGVWIGAIGAVAGSLSLGAIGAIHAGIILITVFLRIILSSGIGEEGSLFSEPYIMRYSVAVIAAFVGTGYEMILSGFSFSSVLFCVFGVLFALLFAFVFSGLFLVDIGALDLVFADKTIIKRKSGSDRAGIILFQASLSSLLFFISLSLREYNYFGISFSYVFAVAVTLFVSRRFGGVRGAVIGFVSSVGVSALYSPAFALLGAVSGALFSFGVGYALVGGGVVFTLWGVYAGGQAGLLSLLAELLIGEALILGVIKKLHPEKEEEVADSLLKTAEELLVATWLSERKSEGSITALEEALLFTGDKVGEYRRSAFEPREEEYRDICSKILGGEKSPLSSEILDKMATKLYKKQRFSDEEIGLFKKLGVGKDKIESLYSVASAYEMSLYERRRSDGTGEEYALISRMITESRNKDSERSEVNEILSARAGEVFSRHGFPEGKIRVFGDGEIRIIGAGLDPDGRLITSPELRGALEGALGFRLGRYEFFRKGNMAVFKAGSVAAFSVDYRSASKGALGSEASGDSVKFFGSESTFFSLISDGMGSGRGARECAELVTSCLSELLLSGVGVKTATSAVSRLVRRRAGESTATVDLFRFDLLLGEGVFIKSGAAPSFIKRGGSVFRIRSESAPIGLLRTVDAEVIRCEIKAGDTVVMLSDGVCASVEDSAWLISFLSERDADSSEEYAAEILELAMKNRPSSDDMTVSVIKILEAV